VSASQLSLFDEGRQDLARAIDLTAEAVNAYADRSDHWVVTFSGGKDSTATLTLLHWLIQTGRVPKPKTLTAMYADTRMELPPLHLAAMQQLDHLKALGVDANVVLPPLDKRYWVYMLGRGVPPPGARFRWCTGIMKLDPMQEAMEALHARHGRLLIFTGVRIGESEARDQRIAVSCSRDGSECGQGYFQNDIKSGLGDMLAPLVHWRVCNVFDWLTNQDVGYAHGYPTLPVVDIYGGDEATEIAARTGCIGCPVASRDKGLEVVIQLPEWAWLTPLLGLRAFWEEMRSPGNRLRKHNERKKDGGLIGRGDRLGPMTFETRLRMLDKVLTLQAECNAQRPAHLPALELISVEEEARILELIDLKTWPDRWDGSETTGDTFFLRSELIDAGHVPLLNI